MGEYEDWLKLLEIDEARKRKENEPILRKHIRAYNKRKGPRVGDWVILKNGILTRFTHDWGDHIQVADDARSGDFGSFYLGKGYCSYSGSLDPGISKKSIRTTKKTKLGRCWFFDHDFPAAHNGVDFKVRFRVFREVCNSEAEEKLQRICMRKEFGVK